MEAEGERGGLVQNRGHTSILGNTRFRICHMQRADPDPDDKNLLNRQRSIPNTGVEIQPKAGLEAAEKPTVPV